MAGTMTRREAREHVLKRVQGLVDRMLPEDENQPVLDGTFWEWEQMADVFDREATAALMEALAGLSGQAKLAHPGACPACGGLRTRWLDPEVQVERRSKHGVVTLPRQVARCRSCGRSFSPSGAGLGPGPPGAPDAPGRRTGVS